MSESITFYYTGSNQFWTVPDNVFSLALNLFGAQGGILPEFERPPPRAGQTTATLSVVPGQELEIIVGGRGQDATGPMGGSGGFGYGNGGNGGSGTSSSGGGGGGGTAVMYDGFPLVAGGSAGILVAGSIDAFGGGLQGGQHPDPRSGKAGTQTSAGLGGIGVVNGFPGTNQNGGDGAGDPQNVVAIGGGGGGGGYFGGGGGASQGFPGGGGSGYVGSQHGPEYPFRNAQTFPNVNDGGNGLVIISYTIRPSFGVVSGRIPVQSLVTNVCQEIFITARVSGLEDDYDFQGSSMKFEVIGPFATIGDLLQSCEETTSLVTRVGVVPMTSSEVESPAFTPTSAGVYRWRLVFETQGLKVSSSCSDESLIFSVNKVLPSLTRYIGVGYETEPGCMDGALWLSKACDPQSSIVCHLEYNGSIVYQENIPVSGNGIYQIKGPLSGPFFVLSLATTCVWKCSFMGDDRNYPTTLCFKC